MTNPDPFKRAEDEYFRLKGQLATGRITRAQFDSALKALMVQDAQGSYWTLGAENGKWYVHQGAEWVQAEPSDAQADKPLSLPERGAPAFAPQSASAPLPATARKSNALVFVLIGALIVVGLGIVAFFVFNSNRAAQNVALQATNTAPADSIATAAPQATASNLVSPTLPLAPSPTPTAPVPTATPALASSNVPNVQVAVVSSASPSPIAVQDFAALNVELAEKINALNQAELKFIRDARQTSQRNRPSGFAFPAAQQNSALLDQDLKDIASKAMDVAILADQLNELAAKQDGGSAQAAQSAEAYAAIARNAFALVIESQTLREQIVNNLVPGAQGIELIAQYGAELWNSESIDSSTGGNPFLAFVKNTEPVQSLNVNSAAPVQSALNGAFGSIWIAQSGTQTTKTINVPAAQVPVTNPFDPQLTKSLTTVEGQSDANKALQVAAANLNKLGAQSTASDPSQPRQLEVATNSVAVAEGGQIKSGELPTFPNGKAVVVVKNSADDENPILQTFGLNGDQPPTDAGKTDVTDAPALVSLSLSDIVIDNVNPRRGGTFEADTSFSFTVNWTTNLGAPQFTLSCNSGNNQTIAQSSGSLTLKGNSSMILYPGIVTVYCYATSANGTSLGSTSVNILVGDAAGATARALQVETDSESLNRTLTADAQGTKSAQETQAAATAQSIATMNALETEVGGTQTAEFKLTANAFGTKQAQPPPDTATPSATPTFTPIVVDQVSHPGNIFAVSTNVVLQPGRLYRFTFSGRVNLINPTRSVSASDLPEHVNGITVPASGIVVVEGTGSVATISCGSGEPDPNDPGAFGITVEDLGPM